MPMKMRGMQVTEKTSTFIKKTTTFFQKSTCFFYGTTMPVLPTFRHASNTHTFCNLDTPQNCDYTPQ